MHAPNINPGELETYWAIRYNSREGCVVVETTVQAGWFVLNFCPKIRHRAVEVRTDENGRATPEVTPPTLTALLLDVVSDPSNSYLTFAIDTSGRCTLQDSEGRIDILQSDRDGLYDLGSLGWTCREPASTSAESAGQ